MYLTEPYILTHGPIILSTNSGCHFGGPPCIVGDEGVESGRVPHYPFLGRILSTDEMTKLYGIPEEASMGGAETTCLSRVPRQDPKDKFKLPAKCPKELRECRRVTRPYRSAHS